MRRREQRAAYGLSAAAFAMALGVASPSSGQPAHDPVMADALFKSAKALLDQGDWPGACAKFEASMQLDPAVSTLLKIARCHEHDGKISLASNNVAEALKLNAALDQPETRRKELEDYAKKLLAALEARMARVRVHVVDRPKDLALTYDGRPLPVAALGELLPVDPGAHRIAASAPGRLPFQRDIALGDGQELDVEIRLLAAPESASTAPAAAPTSGGSQRAIGITVGVTGIAALGVAAALGFVTASKIDGARPYCTKDFATCSDQRGLATLDDARTTQAAAFILLGAGALATGLGTILIVTSKSASSPHASIGVGPFGARIEGAF